MADDVKDVYKSKQLFENWKEYSKAKGIDELSDKHSKIIINYLSDMEQGKNVSRGSRKGARSYSRLNALRIKVSFIIRCLEKRGLKDLNKLNEDIIVNFFDDMTKGRIKKLDGSNYGSVPDYIKDFKSFWHWFMLVNKKEGKEVQDITLDLSSAKEENNFCYFTKEQLEKMLPYFSKDDQVRMLFMFDTIIRCPKELMNLRVSDISEDYKEVTIREETSKTYGRTIKILLCSKELKEYISRKELRGNDFLFDYSQTFFNRKLKKIASSLFGESMTKGGNKFSEISAYDFRHSGACYWRLGAYRSKIDALMYRGGWSNLEILNYYTKKLGMKDSIEKEDLLIGVDKTEMENKLAKQEDQIKQLVKATSFLIGRELGTNPNIDLDTFEEIKKITKVISGKNKLFSKEGDR